MKRKPQGPVGSVFRHLDPQPALRKVWEARSQGRHGNEFGQVGLQS